MENTSIQNTHFPCFFEEYILGDFGVITIIILSLHIIPAAYICL